MRRRWQRETLPDAEACYIAVKACGCVVSTLVIRDHTRAGIQRTVGTWLEWGWLVGRVSAYEARRRLTRCTCETLPDPAQLAFEVGSLSPVRVS